MKFNFQSLAYLLISGLIGFTSCKKDDETKPAPTITINTNNLGSNQESGSAFGGATVKINFTAKADEELKSIEPFIVIGGNSTSEGAQTSDFDSKTSSIEDYEYNVPTTASGSITIKFVVTDSKNQKTEKSFVINITSYSAKLLGAQTNEAGAYFSASTGLVYKSAEANAAVDKVDISYAFLGLGGSTLLSWNARKDATTGLTAAVPAAARKTYFAVSTLTAAQFTALKLPSEISETVSTASPEKISIEEGNVYSFLTQDGKKGLIHIQALATGVSGSATVNVKFAP
jgi:hypothetical protein